MAPPSHPGRFHPDGTTDRWVPQARFERWAAHYDHSQLQQLVYEPVHRQVLTHARRRVPTPARILDVGCGTGRLTRSCARSYSDGAVIGIDPCAEMLNEVGAGTRPVWLQARAEALPFDDHVFDLVVSTLSLRHWQDPYRGLAEISRVTTRNGTVVIADAQIADMLRAAPAAVPHGGSRRAWSRWNHELSALLRGRSTGRSPGASLTYVLRRAGLWVEHVESMVLTLTTVTLIIASRSAGPQPPAPSTWDTGHSDGATTVR